MTVIALAISLFGVGISFVRFDHYSTIYDGFVIDSKENYFILSSRLEKLYVYQKNNEYEIGDFLSIKGEKEKINFTKNESQFDFQDYLNKKGINYELVVNKIEEKFHNPLRIRNRRKMFLSHFQEQERGLIGSLLFSESADSEVVDDIRQLHLGKLIAMTGITINTILAFIDWLFGFFFKKKWSELTSILVLIPYFVFTFPRFSIIRILFLRILKWLNRHLLNKKFTSLQITSVLGSFFLLIDYHLGYQDSFILGFMFPFISQIILFGNSLHKGIKKRLIGRFFAYLFFIPFEIKFYNGWNPLLLIYQPLLTPLFFLVAFCSLLSFYQLPLYKVTSFFIRISANVVNKFTIINPSINVPPFNEWMLLLYFVLMFIVIYYREIKFIPLHQGFTIAVISLLTLYSLPINNIITEQVSFINVGQGDACLIRKQNTTILIDTGGSKYSDIGNDCLIPYFRKQRIYDIDLLITTHDDYDHSGASSTLISNFRVKKYVTSYADFPITIDGITLTNYNTYGHLSDEDNSKSLVIGFSLVGLDFLITGDAPKEIEKYIMADYSSIPCDVLKVGHHGSNTSSSNTFINYLSPKEGVISVGRNYYGHPNNEVLSILKNNHVIIRRTDIEGTITYKKYVFL